MKISVVRAPGAQTQLAVAVHPDAPAPDASGLFRFDWSQPRPAATLSLHADMNRYDLTKAFAQVYAACGREKWASVALTLHFDPASPALPGVLFSAAYAARLAAYRYDRYCSPPKAPKLDMVELVWPEPLDAAAAQALEEGVMLGGQVCHARDLANGRGDVVTPLALAEEAVRLDGQHNISVEVLHQEEMTRLGMGGLLAVSRGAHHPPAFIILRYRGAPEGAPITGIIGKGITYDSGGQSLKGRDNMIDMHRDMSGAAAALAATHAIAMSKLPLNITTVLPACENMLHPKAYRPGDIIKMMSGKTVHIKSTDAEGRLVMADSMTWLCQVERAAALIDIATLTGAASTVFGPLVTAAMADSFDLTLLDRASELSASPVWPMPLFADYLKYTLSDHADLSNASDGKVGLIASGLFLQAFTQGLPWLHLDIAGTAKAEAGSDLNPPGATGVGTALLYYLAQAICAQ